MERLFELSFSVTCGYSGGPVTFLSWLKPKIFFCHLSVSLAAVSAKVLDFISKHVLCQLVIQGVDFIPCISLLEDALILYKTMSFIYRMQSTCF